MEGIGNASTHENGNITWIIDNADIDEFYGGGINAAHPVEGNILTKISNSYVTQFCGGPKFGDMNSNRMVKTDAANCTFGKYFGAGYGGNSYSRRAPYNKNSIINIDWNQWISEEYLQDYNSSFGGVSTQIDYQFLPLSDNTKNVARLWIEYVSFSLSNTYNVTSTLTDFTVLSNFYGGGNLGKVNGSVNSTLDNTTVHGSVYGAGYSATLPKVVVMSLAGFNKEPSYDENLGAFFEPEWPDTLEFSWEHGATVNATSNAINTTTKTLYTREDLTTLGTVENDAILTIMGNSTVLGSVFGGGEQSAVNHNTQVTVKDHTKVHGNVYGGGNLGIVHGNTKVILNGN